MRAACYLACLCIACQAPRPPAHHQSTSTVALSSDDAMVYVVDTDSATLTVLKTANDETVAVVPAKAGAHLVVVASDDTAYAANRLDASLTVVRSGDWASPQMWAAGPEPVGLALSADERLLYVVTAVARDTATHGALLALDAHTGEQRWELALGAEPRSIAVVDDSHAVVTQLKESELTWVDLAGHGIISVAGSSVYATLNAQASADRPALRPLDMRAVALVVDGKSVFAGARA